MRRRRLRGRRGQRAKRRPRERRRVSSAVCCTLVAASLTGVGSPLPGMLLRCSRGGGRAGGGADKAQEKEEKERVAFPHTASIGFHRRLSPRLTQAHERRGVRREDLRHNIYERTGGRTRNLCPFSASPPLPARRSHCRPSSPSQWVGKSRKWITATSECGVSNGPAPELGLRGGRSVLTQWERNAHHL